VGNIDTDPCFVDPCNGDYHLQADSPCIDAGNNDAVLPDLLYDFDGWPRIIGTVDMGIHEYHDYDCNGNGINDIEDIMNGTSLDINGNWIPDECEPDCNGNGIPDNWDIATGTSQDCNGNGIPDECDIANGTSQDINGNGIPDECEPDCNGNGIPDDWDIATGTSQDVDGDGIPDECEPDCNGNGIPDDLDIATGTSQDVNGNGVPDECEDDCNDNGIPDDWDIATGTSQDCNGNGIPDECDIATGTSQDINGNGIPDECEPDCNGNGIPDDWDIATGTSQDVDGDGTPDECEDDCNGNGIPDDWEIATGTSTDYNGNGVPDECEGEYVYVDANAPASGDGLSWPTAYNDLQDALDDAASSAGFVIIYVADGTYTPRDTGDRTTTFQLIDEVVMLGGYAGYGAPEPNVRDVEVYETILSGDLDGNDVEVADPCDLLNEPTRSENCYHVVTGSGTNATAVLDGFTITGGYADGPVSGPEIEKRSGGGIYNEQGSPTIINCIISWNFALVQGGGVGNYYDSDPALSNCSINNNMANTWGGGISNKFGCMVTITNCTFSNNTAGEGGGMYSYNDAEITLIDCIFNGNTTDYDGGGIYHSGVAPATLTNCDFIGNTSGNDGGGMYKSGPSIASPTSCRFISNTAVNCGGGICSSSMTISNSIISGNTAEYGGGLCSRYNANSSLTNCTLTANSASNGNALVCDSYEQSRPSDIQLTNCILWDGGSEVWNNDNSTITITYSDVQGGWPDGNNIDADPRFADTDNGDYHLQSHAGRWDPNTESWVYGDDANSPCIDGGDPNLGWGRELWPHGRRMNMGAYGGTPEASMSPSTVGNIADLNNDNLVNRQDLKMLADKWLYEQVLLAEDLDRNGMVSFVDFAILAEELM
jgi:predicted outer membrane repeat protein